MLKKVVIIPILSIITISQLKATVVDKNDTVNKFLKDNYNIYFLNTYYKMLDNNYIKLNDIYVFKAKAPLSFSSNNCLTVTLSLEDTKKILQNASELLADELPSYILRQTLGLPDPNNPKEVMEYVMNLVKETVCASYATTSTAILWGVGAFTSLSPSEETETKEALVKGERVHSGETDKINVAETIIKENLTESVKKTGKAIRTKDVASENQKGFLELYKVNYKNCMTTINNVENDILNLVLDTKSGKNNKIKGKIEATCKINKHEYLINEPTGKLLDELINAYSANSQQTVIEKDTPIGKILISLSGIKISPSLYKIANNLTTYNTILNMTIDYINSIYAKDGTKINYYVYKSKKEEINFKDNFLLNYLFFNTLFALSNLENQNQPDNVIALNKVKAFKPDVQNLFKRIFYFYPDNVVTPFNIVENLSSYCAVLDTVVINSKNKTNQELMQNPFVDGLLHLFNKNVNIKVKGDNLTYSFSNFTYNDLVKTFERDNISLYNTLRQYQLMLCYDFYDKFIDKQIFWIDNGTYKKRLAFSLNILGQTINKFKDLEAFSMPLVITSDNEIITGEKVLNDNDYKIVKVCTTNEPNSGKAKLIVAYRKKTNPNEYIINTFGLKEDVNDLYRLDTSLNGLNKYVVSYYPQTIYPFHITMRYNGVKIGDKTVFYQGKKTEIPINSSVPVKISDKSFQCVFNDNYSEEIKDNDIKTFVEQAFNTYKGKEKLIAIDRNGNEIESFNLKGLTDEQKKEKIFQYLVIQAKEDIAKKADFIKKRLDKIFLIILGNDKSKGLIDLVLLQLKKKLDYFKN